MNKRLRMHTIASFIMCLVMLFTASPLSAQGVAEVWLNKAAEKLRNKGTEIMFRIHEDGINISGKLLMD